MADPALNSQNRVVRNCGQQFQTGLFLGEGLINDAQGRGVSARIGNTRPP